MTLHVLSILQCGGVAVSGLEMAQNSARLQWSEEEVDAKLKNIMQTCFRTCYETGKEFSDSGALPSREFSLSLSLNPSECLAD